MVWYDDGTILAFQYKYTSTIPVCTKTTVACEDTGNFVLKYSNIFGYK